MQFAKLISYVFRLLFVSLVFFFFCASDSSITIPNPAFVCFVIVTPLTPRPLFSPPPLSTKVDFAACDMKYREIARGKGGGKRLETATAF